MLKQIGNAVIRRQGKEILQIEPWGTNALRVRATCLSSIRDEDCMGNTALKLL